MRVEVVTAVHADYSRFLSAAWASLLSQTHTDWRWLVQIDGPARAARTALVECGAAEDPRVRVATNGTREGPAVTRNVALGRARAALIQNLDADDELEPEALAVLATALDEHPAAGFAVGPARDLLGSGDLVDFPVPYAPGPIPRGALVQHWVTDTETYRLPVHPAGIMWRRELLIAAGGWQALSNMEDTGLLMTASALAPGVVVGQVTLHYRRHRLQRSTQRRIFEGGGANFARSAAGGHFARRSRMGTEKSRLIGARCANPSARSGEVGSGLAPLFRLPCDRNRGRGRATGRSGGRRRRTRRNVPADHGKAAAFAVQRSRVVVASPDNRSDHGGTRPLSASRPV
ncbi:glycosyltransferase family 2 protein [Nocardia cyriacigeorgica]|uniref:glycosyltransferase family 2 protein n=1 Tax=Nocardia cyriacigeorgica TaxID=135487 RepID=UPI0034D3C9A5